MNNTVFERLGAWLIVGLAGTAILTAVLTFTDSEPHFLVIGFHIVLIAMLSGLAIFAYGERAYYLNVLREREQLRSEFRQTEGRLRIISDLMYDYACCYRYDADNDDDAHVEWVVGAFEQITGHSIEQALNSFSLSQPVIPEDLPIFKRRQRKLHSGQPDVSEFRIFDSKHQIRWVRAYGRPEWDEQHQQVVRVYIGVQDITQHKRDEEALRQSEERFATAFRSSPVPMAITRIEDGDPVFMEANAAYLRLVGYTWEEVANKSLLEVGVAIDDEQRDQRLALLQRDGHYPARDVRIRNREGEIRDVIIAAQRLWFGSAVHYLEIILDVTEQRRLEAKLFELAVEKERVKVLSLFAQNVSHELRTPLSVINSSVYLMTKLDDDKRRQQYATVVAEQVARLTQLLDNMLIMTKLDAGVPFKYQSVDLNDMVAQVALAARNPGIALQFDFDAALPTFKVDASWLRMAFRHLIDNALTYTPASGTVVIRSWQCSNAGVIEIVDTGIGISAEALPYIFQRFWRQDEAHATPGFGLGLSIAQKIVEQHGGSIEVESVLGQGSAFRVKLPLPRPPMAIDAT